MYNEFGEYIGGNSAPGENSQSNHEYVEGPESVDTPHTGDENNLVMWIILSSIFAAGAWYSMRRVKGKQN